ncbi:MAG: ATP-dependent protease ATPase subunit HslU [Deferribacterota bacterium]|nr:ATP-dependent protease ATPase subunit HslU [Deferribacterota bacterium]
MESLTPKEIVSELDKYIIGQGEAKKAVAIALRNRYRRLKLPKELQDEVVPKNIIMVGPTGVGKTEIARRLAKLTGSPFTKVEATKFTEVGYVGRDVDSIIRELADIAFNLVKEEKRKDVLEKAKENAEERILDLLLPKPRGYVESESESETRNKFKKMLKNKQIEDRFVEVEVEDGGPNIGILTNMGIEDVGMNLQDMFKNMFPKRKKRKKMSIKEARKIIEAQEVNKLIDMDEVKNEAIKRVESSGIVFIDEIDKVCSADAANFRSADVSREGVQRDLLPMVEGSTIVTKYGLVRTDHILFIAAGAFHTAKPSDLIPELQGRFPIRVELQSLNKMEFIRILKEPKNALTKQYKALLNSDGVEIYYEDSGIERIAEIAEEVNATNENIGARRLYTIMEKLLEDISFDAPDTDIKKLVINREYVDTHLSEIVSDKDLTQYIL